jgi:hypothetical protein
MMMVGTLYRKAPSRRNAPPTEADVERTNYKITKNYYEKHIKYSELFEFVEDVELTDKYYADSEQNAKDRVIEKKIKEAEGKLSLEDVAELVKAKEEKPKRKRRTKEEIEADNAKN